MTTIMENSGIYKKALCSNGICNGDGRAVRLLSQSHAGEDRSFAKQLHSTAINYEDNSR